MRLVRNIYRGLFVLGCGLFAATVAFGAEEGGSAAEQSAGGIFKWIHFVVLVGILYWAFGKWVRPKFRRDADNISSAITKATAAKAEAERKLQEAITKMGNLEREIAEFRVQAQRDAAAEMERLRGVTVLDVEKIRAAAKAEIAATERAARVELKELAAKLAVDGAESLVAKQMTPTVQEAMISSFVQSLQRRPN
jgi:F-type H+-transporting ATPase subunit b